MACSYLSVSIFWTLLSELWWASANHVALLLTLMPKFRLISVLLSVIVPHYKSLAGALHYLTFTRPDISYAVQQICLHMHDSREPHLSAVKRVIQYLCGTLNYGLLLHRGTTSELTVYTNADWASPPSHKHQRPLHKLDWMVSQDIQASDLQHLMCASTDSIEVCKPRLTLS